MNPKESSAFYYLSIAADLVIANVLCVLCCVPVFTIGASLSAVHKVIQDLVMGREDGMIRSFFSAFRDNFRQATIVFFGFSAAIISVICQGILIRGIFSGTVELVLLLLLTIIVFLLLMLQSMMCSLMVRYRNRIWEHMHNALLLMATRPVRSACVAALGLTPVLLWGVAPGTFWRTAILWPFIGISGISLLENFIMRPVFIALEQAPNINYMEGE